MLDPEKEFSTTQELADLLHDCGGDLVACLGMMYCSESEKELLDCAKIAHVILLGTRDGTYQSISRKKGLH